MSASDWVQLGSVFLAGTFVKPVLDFVLETRRDHAKKSQIVVAESTAEDQIEQSRIQSFEARLTAIDHAHRLESDAALSTINGFRTRLDDAEREVAELRDITEASTRRYRIAISYIRTLRTILLRVEPPLPVPPLPVLLEADVD